jgi:hypothetical protein
VTSRAIRRRRSAAVLVVLAAALAAVLASRSPGTSSSLTTAVSTPIKVLRGEHRDGLGTAAGAIPAGTTVFDDDVPGVARLDPTLLGALRQAATAAQGDGVTFVVDSGWRSRAYQAHLLDEAIAKYGSRAEAARWVASPDTSEHVHGDAVDLAADAAAWLANHGAGYGLCRVYANEPWHFELRPGALDAGCPPTYADPTQDPRMQR